MRSAERPSAPWPREGRVPVRWRRASSTGTGVSVALYLLPCLVRTLIRLEARSVPLQKSLSCHAGYSGRLRTANISLNMDPLMSQLGFKAQYSM